MSEYGYDSNVLGVQGQAENIGVAMRTLGNMPDRVAAAMYFTLQDFDDTVRWGLTNKDGTDKPGFAVFQANA